MNKKFVYQVGNNKKVNGQFVIVECVFGSRGKSPSVDQLRLWPCVVRWQGSER